MEQNETEYDSDSITIIIPKKNKSKKSITPIVYLIDTNEYDEIDAKYITHLHGSFIKYFDIDTGIHYTGGFVSKVYNSNTEKGIYPSEIIIRIPAKSETVSVMPRKNRFFVKKTNENYIAVKDLFIYINKLKFELSRK